MASELTDVDDDDEGGATDGVDWSLVSSVCVCESSRVESGECLYVCLSL